MTVSSTEAPFAGAHAVDGDPGTRWSSAFADPQWIQVDLGGSARISEVALNREAAYAEAFQVQVSADARLHGVGRARAECGTPGEYGPPRGAQL